ncbi:MAG: polynucleotide adenylyltransferase, partial [Opitutae bacterium]|nr:polynucleotide adenylyltransferase [Opitutae bacterium]
MPLMTDLREQFPSQELFLVRDIAEDVAEAGGQVICVGGCVRDALLQIAAEEFDLEVSGMDPEELRALLARKHSVDEYGKSFGVLKLKGQPIEVSVPRSETKSSTGHRGFSVDVDPHLPFPKAAARRDFTVNAIGLDPLTGELL